MLPDIEDCCTSEAKSEDDYKKGICAGNIIRFARPHNGMLFFPMFTDSQCHICSEVRVLQLSEELVLIFQEDLTYSRFLLFNVTFGKMFLCCWLWFVTLM